LLHSEVRCFVPAFPPERRPMLPWACVPLEECRTGPESTHESGISGGHMRLSKEKRLSTSWERFLRWIRFHDRTSRSCTPPTRSVSYSGARGVSEVPRSPICSSRWCSAIIRGASTRAWAGVSNTTREERADRQSREARVSQQSQFAWWPTAVGHRAISLDTEAADRGWLTRRSASSFRRSIAGAARVLFP
jgi:hypothetical protein